MLSSSAQARSGGSKLKLSALTKKALALGFYRLRVAGVRTADGSRSATVSIAFVVLR